VMQIVELTALSWGAVNKALKLFQEGGESALKPAARGRKPGSGRLLTAEQEADIRSLIRARRPRHYGLKDLLWNLDTVRLLIDSELNIRIDDRALYNYLKAWGVILRASSKSLHDRCAPAVRAWLKTDYRRIEQDASDRNAEIYWLHPPARLDPVMWCPAIAKETPVAITTENIEGAWDSELWNGESSEYGYVDEFNAPPTASRVKKKATPKASLVSATNNRGKHIWLIVQGAFTSDYQKSFIGGLLKDTNRKAIFLIRNNMNMYGGAAFLDWILPRKKEIWLFPDSPRTHTKGEGEQLEPPIE